MKKMILICFCFCMSLGLASCDDKNAVKPEFDEAAVLERAEEVITFVNEENYNDALSNIVPELEVLTPEKLKEANDNMGDKGAFVEFKDHEMIIQNNFAVMGVIASYEHMDIQYTLSFDKGLALAGFYLKQV